MKKIKIKKNEINRKGENMSLEIVELYELKDAIQTLQTYQERINIYILHRNNTQKLLSIVENSIREKEKTDLADRITNIEIALSKISNKEEKKK